MFNFNSSELLESVLDYTTQNEESDFLEYYDENGFEEITDHIYVKAISLKHNCDKQKIFDELTTTITQSYQIQEKSTVIVIENEELNIDKAFLAEIQSFEMNETEFVMTVTDKENPDKLFRIPVYMDNFIHPQSI
jgi:hypothetical protein